MVYPRAGGFTEIGTLLRIVRVDYFRDGRSIVETVGTTRFRIVEHSTLDGYVVAKIQTINDISIPEEEELEAAETTGSREILPDTNRAPHSRFPLTIADIDRTPTINLMEFASDFVQRMKSKGAPFLDPRALILYGECPEDPAIFPWWFASVFYVPFAEKYRLLGTVSVRERLKICCRWVIAAQNKPWLSSSCSVM
ncbi:hypothetical protein VTK56DRAFT_8485 [Thermocarpiscus australiensis]